MDNPSFYGFRPAGGRWGADQVPVRRHVATAYQAAPGAVNVDLNIGDAVKRQTDGSVIIGVEGATNALLGVIVGISQYYDAGLGALRKSDKLPGGTAYASADRRSELLILPFQGTFWEVEVDDAVTATTEAAYRALIGQNVNMIYQASSTTGKCNPKVDISLNNTTNTFQFNIVDVSPTVNNQDFAGANVKLIVVCNLPDENPPLIAGV